MADKAACYLRVSTEKQTAENQRGEVETMCRARGFEPVFYEEQESAVKRRPEFERMMDDARRGKVRAVFIWAIDRFHRSRAEGARAIEQLDHWRVPVASVREAWLDTGGPLRAVLIQILLWVAEGERGRLIERTRAGLDRARRQGKRLGRPPVDSVMLAAGARFVGDGKSIRQAAKLAGISEATLRRHLAAVDAPALAA